MFEGLYEYCQLYTGGSIGEDSDLVFSRFGFGFLFLGLAGSLGFDGGPFSSAVWFLCLSLFSLYSFLLLLLTAASVCVFFECLLRSSSFVF